MRQDVIFRGVSGNGTFAALTPDAAGQICGNVQGTLFVFNDQYRDMVLSSVQARPLYTAAQRAATDALAASNETTVSRGVIRLTRGGKFFADVALGTAMGLGGCTGLETLNSAPENGQVAQFAAPVGGEGFGVAMLANATDVTFVVVATFIRNKKGD